MYLIEERTYMIEVEDILQLEEARLCYDVVEAVSRMGLSQCDTYWITKRFTSLIRQRVHPHVTSLVSMAALVIN